MITAIVQYRLPAHIDRDACRAHFHGIAPDFANVSGLISKHFICGDDGCAGGVYQWESRAKAEAFYGGPWRDGIVERYGMPPEIRFFDLFAKIDNAAGIIEIFERDEYGCFYG